VPLCKRCHIEYDKESRIAGIRANAWKLSDARKGKPSPTLGKTWSEHRRSSYEATIARRRAAEQEKVSAIPKLKADEYDIDFDALEKAEYDPSTGQSSYKGEIPPKGTDLAAFVKGVWWCETSGGEPMIKVLTEAAGNEGTPEEQYDGLGMWENMALNAKSKWKWAPFFEAFGITLQDIRKKTVLADDDDNVGAPITKIGTFVPGSDESWCRVITDRERYNGTWSARVDQWLPWEETDEAQDAVADEADEEDETDTEEELEAETDEADADEEDGEPEEPEEQTPPPAARRRRATTPAATAPAAAKTTRAKAPAAAPTAPATRRAAKAPAAAATATPARRGRRAPATAGYTDEPPF
jgi:hypothetical protein